MQAYSCLVVKFILVAGLTLVMVVCLITNCLFNHMQAYSCLVAERTLAPVAYSSNGRLSMTTW